MKSFLIRLAKYSIFGVIALFIAMTATEFILGPYPGTREEFIMTGVKISAFMVVYYSIVDEYRARRKQQSDNNSDIYDKKLK